MYADVALYDLRRNSWTQTTAVGSELPAGRDGHSMVAIDDTVYIFGGVGYDQTYLPSTSETRPS